MLSRPGLRITSLCTWWAEQVWRRRRSSRPVAFWDPERGRSDSGCRSNTSETSLWLARRRLSALPTCWEALTETHTVNWRDWRQNLLPGGRPPTRRMSGFLISYRDVLYGVRQTGVQTDSKISRQTDRWTGRQVSHCLGCYSAGWFSAQGSDFHPPAASSAPSAQLPPPPPPASSSQTACQIKFIQNRETDISPR